LYYALWKLKHCADHSRRSRTRMPRRRRESRVYDHVWSRRGIRMESG